MSSRWAPMFVCVLLFACAEAKGPPGLGPLGGGDAGLGGSGDDSPGPTAGDGGGGPVASDAGSGGGSTFPQDVGVVGEPDVGVRASFGDPCDQGTDCVSGNCVDSADGRVCSRACADETDCPEGWLCVADLRDELHYVCFPDESDLCAPCSRDADCPGQGSRCLGIGAGSFCGRKCGDRRPCPTGYRCADILAGDTTEVVDQQCRPADDRCGECVDMDGDEYGIGHACLGEDCADDDVLVYPGAPERCNGSDDDCDREVDEDALDLNACGECGELPEEVCNGEDDDCDGLPDEGLEEAERLLRDCSTDCGVGAEECIGGEWFNCSAPPVIDEICGDGIDNDCRGGDEINPDEFEPNDSCDSAADLGGDQDNRVYRPRIDSVNDESDFFRFRADDGTNACAWPINSYEHLNIDVREIPAGLQLELVLYRGVENCRAGRVFTGAQVCDGHPCIRWQEDCGDDDTGNYFVEVRRVSGHECVRSYELRIDGLN